MRRRGLDASFPATGRTACLVGDEREAFWSLIWDYCGVVGDKGERVLVDGDRMPGARFFPDARLNFAENLLRRKGARRRARLSRRGQGRAAAVLGRAARAGFAAAAAVPGRGRQAGRPGRGDDAEHARDGRGHAGGDVARRGVVVLLARFRRAGRARPLRPDRARASSSRCDGYWYGGKAHRRRATRSRRWRRRLPTVRDGADRRLSRRAPTRSPRASPKAATLDDALRRSPPAEVDFERLPFAHPLYILFSSGTTGVPKCIVHSAGGTLLQHLKEHRLHAT